MLTNVPIPRGRIPVPALTAMTLMTMDTTATVRRNGSKREKGVLVDLTEY